MLLYALIVIKEQRKSLLASHPPDRVVFTVTDPKNCFDLVVRQKLITGFIQCSYYSVPISMFPHNNEPRPGIDLGS